MILNEHAPVVDDDGYPKCFCCSDYDINMFNPTGRFMSVPTKLNPIYKNTEIMHYLCIDHETMGVGHEMWQTVAEVGL